MQVIFIIFLSTWGYNSLGDPTRQQEVWKKILLQADPIKKADSMRLGGEHKTKLNYSTYQTKFNTKMTKIKWNCMAY